MKLVDSAAMAAIDGRAQGEYLFPSLLLMENAGLKSWRLLREGEWGGAPPARPVFLAGAGNNGGDAFVMARQCLLEGGRPVVVLAGGAPPASGPARVNWDLCSRLGIPGIPWPDGKEEILRLLGSADRILDGISGTGLRGPLRRPLADLVEALNAAAPRDVVTALDVPSGVGDGFRPDWPAVRASCTLALGLPKICLYLPAARSLCGRIRVVDIGFPPDLAGDPSIPGELLEAAAADGLLPPVAADAHKGTRGSVAVFAGSPGTTGAAWLAAHAAARSRAGLVSLYLDPETYPLLASRVVSVMAKPWKPGAPDDGFDPSRHQALLVGPGWGVSREREEPLRRLLASGLPGVLDADGLTLHARLGDGGGRTRFAGRWILTPHPAEFSRLTGTAREEVLADPLPAVLRAAAALDAVVALKGHCTWIASPDGRFAVWDGMEPALATGGSGDVLAGIAAGLLAGGVDPFTAARAAVCLHARAGRLARAARGWFLAEDLVERVSEAMP